MPYCPECGGDLYYDPRLKRYACKSCGLSLSYRELVELRDKNRPESESDREQKKKRHNEYLKWWFSKK